MDNVIRFTFKSIDVLDPLIVQVTDRGTSWTVSRYGNLFVIQGRNGLILPISKYELALTLHPMVRQLPFNTIKRNKYEYIVNDKTYYNSLAYDIVAWAKSAYIIPKTLSDECVTITDKQ